MTKVRLLLFCLSCTWVIAANAATDAVQSGDGVQEINWDRMIPDVSAELTESVKSLQGEMDALTEAQQEIYFQIEDEQSLRRRIDAGFVAQERLFPREKALLEKNLGETNPDMVALWKRVKATRKRIDVESTRVDDSLDGIKVRMPGYVLPLEMDGSNVREFLLVPFVGACIHVPPPPANQMVFVQADESFASDGLYEAVWVEGVITTNAGSHALSLVDGERSVSTGYSLRATRITRHEP